MGIRYFCIRSKQMDLINYDQQKFQAIEKEIAKLSGELGLEHVKIIPVSATEGDNITKRSETSAGTTAKSCFLIWKM